MSLHDFAQSLFTFSIDVALVLLGVAFLLTVIRIMVGPTLPDRVLGLDMLTSVAIGFIAVIGIDTGFTLYVDIAIALGLVGFLATVAFARFIQARGKTEEERIQSLPFQEPRSGHGAARQQGETK
ncbi:cation:proton antiporter [Aurantimonas sp. A2-1-M11]|uniref:cation:proton antiporter n=1 Tax=Aurantimonas sp. A2-1-M11 TaxID=3113712 RepID=UPI002F9396AD